jgi:outer membrane receptor protein involved in Fe transport
LRTSSAARFLALSFLFLSVGFAQSPNGTISGIVHDPSDRPIPDADVLIVSDLTNIQYQTKTSDEGIYIVRDLPPGQYRIQITKRGFKTLIKPGLILNVQNALSVSITLPLGAVSEVVTVDAGAPLINTTDATVSTVVDRQFAENLPMNGRSFQSLIELTPGVVLTPSSPTDGGQFSVDGQRAASNYWMVDGVGANVGISSNLIAGNGLGGALGSFSAFGGTNSLVSVDAMQEFRVQTSGYAPEFGRTPGGQISIVTRSGTNRFHGTVFDYIRNDVFDANNWFNTSIAPSIPKPEERQNDFGGTFGGPIVKDHTFFFFSYEGLRLRLPQTALTNVPDESARKNANPSLQPYLNAFPLPNGPDDLATGVAQLNASYSNPASLDAYSLRVDHNLSDKLQLFGRYNFSPSEIILRGNGAALSTISPSRISMQTGTAGLTWAISASTTNDLRFNYSQTDASSNFNLDGFGGAVPLASLPFPAAYTQTNGQFSFGIISLGTNYRLSSGANARNTQRQFNVVENFSLSKGSHTLKFGADFRRLAPSYDPYEYFQEGAFLDVPSSEGGASDFTYVQSNRNANFLFKNLGLFTQDTWRVTPRLTVTYGLRWDVDFPPESTSGPSFPAVTGFNLNDLSGLALSSTNIPPYKTTYNNFAPRVGAAYQISQKRNRSTVLRGGFGVFYDLATSETGNAIGASYPFGAFEYNFGGAFPLSPEAAAPPAITPENLSSEALLAFDPKLKLPYTLQWNIAIEQGLGAAQSLSISYIGASGRRLIQTADVLSPNANIAEAVLVTNAATSSYNAAQIKFERRLSRGLQLLTSYTFSHSIDDASAGSEYGNFANLLVPGLNTNANRGPSDFDIRNGFSAGLTYELLVPRVKPWADRLFRGWSVQSFVFARSAPPVSLSDIAFFEFRGVTAQIRPDVVPDQSYYLYGPQYPGGVAFNPAAFTGPPVDPVTGSPTRQGNLGRNALRAFGATQWDFALHRDFHFWDRVTLQFRAEMFNLLNHPNFGPEFNEFGSSRFGVSTQMLGASLNSGNLGGGAFSPLYQIGGSRSMQFALKLSF